MLDFETKKLYEDSLPQSEIPWLDSLLDFVSQWCKIFINIGTTANKMEQNLKRS